MTSRKTISAISGSVIPACVCSAMFASTSKSSRNARCQATAPAPPVCNNVPSMSNRTALITRGSVSGPCGGLVLAPGRAPRRRGEEKADGGRKGEAAGGKAVEKDRHGRVGGGGLGEARAGRGRRRRRRR